MQLTKPTIATIDLNFQGRPQAIAVYVIGHSSGAVLIECGPGSTHAALQTGLADLGFSPRDVTHVLLTHIHLDHAGAAGWWARQGAQIIVHPVGAPHLLNPEKLLASATRIYGDRMQSLWGEFLSAPADKLRVVQDAEEIAVGALRFVAINTPGHAEHHYAYVFEDMCFTGDVGGVRIPGYPYVQVPLPPPEVHIPRWRESLKRLRSENFARIAPTHFGIFDDPLWHLDAVEESLAAANRWLEEVMPVDPPIEVLRESYAGQIAEQARRMGLSPEATRAFEIANPPGMSADGLQRYWKKSRMRP
jgi:glyoxylase-like metal-dependent hydrolase (beta-lactamase superfamily II)